MATNSGRRPSEGALRIGDLDIYPDRLVVRRGAEQIPIRQQTLRVLLHLIEHRDQLVSRERLHAAIWGDTAVTPDALVQCIVEIRRILGDSAREPRFVRTVPKIGYAFIGPTAVRSADEPVEAARPAPFAAPAPRPRWPRRVAAGLVTAVAVLVGVLAVARTTSRPADWPSASAGRKRVVVLPFENHSRDQGMAWLRTGLPNMVITGLGRSPALSAVTLTELRPSLDASRNDQPSLADGLAIAKAARADAVVSGSFAVMDDTLRVDVRIQTPAGETLGGDAVVAGRRDGVLTEVDRLSAHLAKALGAGVPARVALQTSDVMTRDLDAYRDYILGVERANAMEAGAALDLFESAARRDPGFAMAHARIGATYAVTLGRADQAQPHLARAFQMADRLRENDRLWILAWYSLARLDYEGATSPLRTLLAKYPDDIEAYSILSKILTGQERWAEALAVIEQGLAIDPDAKDLHNQASATYALSGKGGAALEAARRYVAAAPHEANARDSLGLRLQGLGRYEEAVDEFDRALALNPRFDIALLHKANTYFAEGRYREAAAAYDGFMRATPSNAGRSLSALAWIADHRGDHALAWQLAQRAALAFNVAWPANVFAIARRDPAAYRRVTHQDLLQTWSNRGAPWPPILVHYRSALGLRAGGRAEDALVELRAAAAHPPLDWAIEGFEDCLAETYFELGRWEDARGEYQRLVGVRPWVARYHYRLAELADRRRDAATAIDEYRRFLSLWPKADPDLPDVIAAKARLTAY